MGYYVNHNSKGESLPSVGKAQALVADGATPTKPYFQPNLVCVVENGPFDAAGYCYSEGEFKAFTIPGDLRRKTWLIYEPAAKLSGYDQAADAHIE
jgi:hypothetical protein